MIYNTPLAFGCITINLVKFVNSGTSTRYNEGPRLVVKFVCYSKVSFFIYFIIRGLYSGR